MSGADSKSLDSHADDEVLVGSGGFRYRTLADWPQLPDGYQWLEVAAVATNSRHEVVIFNRGEHPVIICDAEGRFLKSWGEGAFVRAHGITIGPDDAVYCCDDLDHTVHKYTADGELVWKLGTSGAPSDTGATSIDYRTIRYAGPPFHYPTDIALSAEGDIFISDGYGNARVHRFSTDGRLILSWGEPGAGPGQFGVPHGIGVHRDGQVYVADRENSRIQIFSQQGEYLDQITDLARPSGFTWDADGNLYVAELGYRAGLWPGTTAPYAGAPGGRVTILDPQRNVITRWGGGEHPTASGDFFATHDIWIDAYGDLYVSEVNWTAGVNRGLMPAGCHCLQKFVRVRTDLATKGTT